MTYELWGSIYGGACKEPLKYADTVAELRDYIVGMFGEIRASEKYGDWFGIKDQNGNLLSIEQVVDLLILEGK